MSLKMKFLLIIPLLVISGLLIWYYFYEGAIVLSTIIQIETVDTLILSIGLIAGVIILYKVGLVAIKASLRRSKSSEGEVTMMNSVFRFGLVIVVLIVLMGTWSSLGTLSTLFAAFGGMIFGWALQAPISGAAAWLLVSIMRPFRVGDRVQFPAHGLVGDIVSISPLYTTLNQVGGSVGSEEPANRTVLIPNAMLFSTLIINYTPKNQEELMKSSKQHCLSPESQSAYMLDEFVLRLSFDSDWDEAETILMNVAKEVTSDIIKATGQQPYLRADFGDWYGVFLRLRFMTNATERPKIIYEISKRIFKAVQDSKKVDLAIPYIYSYRKAYQSPVPGSLERSMDMQGNQPFMSIKAKNTPIQPLDPSNIPPPSPSSEDIHPSTPLT